MTTATTRRRTPAEHDHRCCAVCGSYLAENLLGQLHCLLARCAGYRKVVDTLPRDIGSIPADLTAEHVA